MHVKISGSGPALVLLHGWGMNADVWDEVATHLARQFRVHSIDLPGHGSSRTAAPYTLDAIVDALGAACVPRATVCGWSLGGQLALRWARMKPAQVERLIVIASTPRFVQSPGWECGMKSGVFDAFAQDVARDSGGALQRFSLLQAHGDTAARTIARRLRECIAARRGADPATLAAGLQILADTDLRAELAAIAQSVLIVHGDRDRVVPLAAGVYLQRNLPHARLDVIAGAAHVPFIGQQRDIARRIAAFCHG